MLLHPFLVDDAPPIGQLRGLGPGPYIGGDALDDAWRAERDTLVVELVGDQVPALILAPHQRGGRYAHILVEGVVDVVVAQELHGHDADARGVHGDQEHRDALVLGHVGVGAGGEPDVVGVAGQAGEDLGAVDDVLVTVAHGPGGQRCEVGARVRLGVADTEVDLPGQDLGEEVLLLLLRAEVHDGRAHGVDGQHGHGCAAAHGLVEEDELFNGRATLATPLGWPADAEPAVASHLLDDLAHHGADAACPRELFLELRGQQVLVVGAQLALEPLLLLGKGNLHGVSLPRGGAASTHVSAMSPWPGRRRNKLEHVTVRFDQAANGTERPLRARYPTCAGVSGPCSDADQGFFVGCPIPFAVVGVSQADVSRPIEHVLPARPNRSRQKWRHLHAALVDVSRICAERRFE